MKKRIAALLAALLTLTGMLAACKGDTPADTGNETATESAVFAENAVTARNLDALSNEEHTVMMLVLLKDGWIMDVSLGMLYDMEPGAIQGMAYEAVSDEVFRWIPDEEPLYDGAENPNFEMRIIYSDPDGRFIVYSPNVEKPDLANIIMNPDYFADVADEESKVTDSVYHYFYKIKDNGLKKLSKEIENLPGFDDQAKMNDD